MQADAIQTDFSDTGPHTPDKQLIALYKTHLTGIYNNHIKDKNRDNTPYDEVFNLIDKLREFFAWIYYFLKERKINPINTTNLTELNKYTYKNNFVLDKYSDEHVEAVRNIYIIMEQFAIHDHPLFHLDVYFFHRLLYTDYPCDDHHKYPTHLVFLKHLCDNRVRGPERPDAMVEAYPHAVWMDYPLFFPDGNARLTDAEILSYSLTPAAAPPAPPAPPAPQVPPAPPAPQALPALPDSPRSPSPSSPETSYPLDRIDIKKTGGSSRSSLRDRKLNKSNRITHKKRK